ncbi:MAG: glycosyltransferase [Nocardioides sp.]
MTEIRGRDVARRVAGRTKRAAHRLVRGAPDAEPTAPEAIPGPAPVPPAHAAIAGSAAFEPYWYGRQVGRRFHPEAAARHYLEKGVAARAQPHRLFDPDFFVSQLDDELVERLAEGDPLSFYLRRRMFWVRTHPLFDTGGYLRRNPEAKQHPAGPLGHYSEVGAAAGLAPNSWLPPDDEEAETKRYPDLREWISARHDEWEARRDDLPRVWQLDFDSAQEADYLASHPAVAVPRPRSGASVVSVVLDAGVQSEHLLPTLDGLTAQTLDAWELVVVDRGYVEDLPGLVVERVGEGRVRFVDCVDGGVSEALTEALNLLKGDYVAFLDVGDVWTPDRLRVLVGFLHDQDGPVAADVLRGVGGDQAVKYAVHGHPGGMVRTRRTIDLARLVIRRDVVRTLGDVAAPPGGSWAFDLVLRLSALHDVPVLPVVGVHRAFKERSGAYRLPHDMRKPVDRAHVESRLDVCLNRRLIDWDGLGRRTQDLATVSVIIPTFDDWKLTRGAVQTVLASDGVDGIHVECIVWDNGSSATVGAVLDSLVVRHPSVRLVHSPVNHGFALGNNLAVPLASGATVMFLNNDTTVPERWLGPVVEALGDPDVLGVQSLLVYPSGSVQSAGVAFPSTGGLPHALLQGFPVEDAAGIEQLELRALTGAALAMRFEDVVAMRGFDPVFTNGMEDVDLCQRLSSTRPGHFRVVGEAPVTHFESRTPGRYDRYMDNRLIYLDRWQGVDEPRDDVDLWGRCGFRVVDHQVVRTADWQDRRLCVPLPVLVRPSRLQIDEAAPRLRWAVKNPAPAGDAGERWGDTHFARAVASALRTLGQEVVVDHRGEFERATSRHDDVALALRGLAAFHPSPEQVSIGWVISHPQMLSRAEAAAYDRLVAASVAWSQQRSRDWGIVVEPMLQATDPELFHPGRAVPDTGHPVLFVGNSRKHYRTIVKDAVEAGLPLSVYGDLWGRFIPKRFVKDRYLDNLQLGAVYRSAGTVLNDHWEDMRVQGFLSNRLFDAAASGARVITDDVAGLDDLFGRSVQVYRSRDDLVRLTSLADPDSVFGSDEERADVAARIAREHSFLARAERLIEIAVEARKRRGFTT